MTDIIKALLNYQQVDLEADRIEREILGCDERRKANVMKQRYESASEEKKKINNKLIEAAQELDQLTAECDSLIKVSDEKIVGDKLVELDDISAVNEKLSRLIAKCNKAEEQINAIQTQSFAMERRLAELSAELTKSKNEFNESKDAYQKKLEAARPELEEARKNREKAEKGIDVTMLNRYKALKKDKKTPLAKIDGRSCSGCHMEMSAMAISTLAKKGYFECENCGRIVFND